MDSKVYSWKWVVAAELLSHGPCEFLYARLTPTLAANVGEVTLYDGESVLGNIIVILGAQFRTNSECNPPVPIYCREGLFMGAPITADGVLVIWRELKHKAE